MIYKLQRRFILISTVSVLLVIVLVFGVIVALNVSSLNRNMDILADRVSEGGGRFPGAFEEKPHPDIAPPREEQNAGFLGPETPFSTRHFTVLFDKSNKEIKTITESIYAISDDQAVKYAKAALGENRDRGWMSNYRYKVFSTDMGTEVVFVDGSMNRSAMVQSIAITGVVLLACAVLVLALILLLSKRAVKPIAESYEKQKQFITDANHELKPPLTLILANLDIAENELGKNEWLEDIRSEGNRMTELVNQLVALSRMDEENHTLELEDVALGRMVADMVSEFEPLAVSRGKTLEADIDVTVVCRGDEALLRRLMGILLDNAIKYCDCGGNVTVALHRGRHIVLTVENTYAAVGELELNRLFDRFYRADKARTFKGGYGAGLAMAKAIAEKHKGQITAYKLESVGLDEDEASRRVLKLSGGQQQRVAIARALSYDPDIILADEPTGNLDRDTQKEIMEIFRDLADQGKCVILVSHSYDVAMMCDERYELTKLQGKATRKKGYRQK